ncbi:hypothetical protein GW17_00029110 [Ensete ventricosum]|nr:hypothetical protein GW17_00029110 [Ensete ventricosum]
MVRAICTGPPGYRYADHPLPGGTGKIDRQRPIEGEIDHRRSISTIGSRLREKKKEEAEEKKKEAEEKKKERRRKKYLLSPRHRCPRP